MHSRLSVTEGLENLEVEIVNDLAIDLVLAVILCMFVRISIRAKHD